MNVIKLYLGCLGILFLPFWGYAQQYDFRTISVNQGLAHGEVHHVLQSSNNLIWIATNGGGLIRYDGHNFETYTTQDGLRSNAVHRIFEDSNENLWIANDPGGVVKFRADSLVNPFPNAPLSNFEVWDIEELNDNEIWFSTYRGGIFIWDGKQFEQITMEDGLTSNSVWDIFKSDSGKAWLATEEGITVLDDTVTTSFTAQDGLSGNRIYKIIEDSTGLFWIATNNGISTWDGQHFETIGEINGISLDYIFDIREASNGDIWIGTETQGVFIYDGNNYTHLTRKNGLSSNYVYHLYEDRNQNMWVATNENGISLFKGDAFLFYNEDFGLASNAVLSLFRDNNDTLWIGTQEGIQSYNGEQFTSYAFPKKYDNHYIREIAQLPNGDMLFVMPDDKLMRYDGNHFYDFSLTHNLGDWFIYDVFVDTDDKIWFGTDEGLHILDNDVLTTFTIDDGLPGNVVQHINKVTSEEYHLSTTSGFSIFDGQGFQNVTIEDGLNNNSVNYSIKGPDDNIWVGTSGGISVLKPDAASGDYTISNFGQQEGMTLVTTHFLWFDEQGYLWQGTNGGLTRLNVPGYKETQTMRLVRYGLIKQGLGVEFNFNAIAEDSTKNVWLGSMNGALKLSVNKLRYPKHRPTPRITNIERNGKSIDWDDFSEKLHYKNGQLVFPSVTFPYGEHSYTFSYSGINYQTPENIRYRYKVEGFDKDWMPVTSVGAVTYTNLEPGDYTFKVQAMQGVGGNWNLETASYAFSIAYPFWQRSWFIGLLIITIIGLIYGYIRVRVGMIEKKRLKLLVDEQTQDLQEALEEKEVLIKEIHHRVKNNLAVISGLLELQMGHADNKFVDRVLSESQRRVQSISMIHEKLYQNERLAEIDFEKYIRELVEIIAYSFNYTDKKIDVDINIDNFKLGVNQGIPCGLILNELVSNAFEHAFVDKQEGKIVINVEELKQDTVHISVSDNGKGLPHDFDIKQEETLGITLIKTLCKQLAADLKVRNSNGAQFVIEFQRETPSLNVPV